MYSWKTVLVTIGLLFGLKVWNPYLIENITWSWFDFLHQSHEVEQVEDIVLVDIDEKSLEKYGQYPWPRNIYADIMLESHYSNTHVYSNACSNPRPQTVYTPNTVCHVALASGAAAGAEDGAAVQLAPERFQEELKRQRLLRHPPRGPEPESGDVSDVPRSLDLDAVVRATASASGGPPRVALAPCACASCAVRRTCVCVCGQRLIEASGTRGNILVWPRYFTRY